MVKAWGAKALDSFAGETWVEKGENLDENNILPLGNPWYWDPAQLNGSEAFQRQRLLDTLHFLYELQNEFYARYVKAMRQSGYAGEIISSNWQAGRALSHYCNLHSDALVGTVDRHNYFGGGDKSRINNATMLAVPGSGTLSTGLQQVANRPFMLSEWIHVRPNEWGVEGPAIIGAYGMGLQGWDVSFMFQNRDNGTFSQRVDRDRWDVTITLKCPYATLYVCAKEPNRDLSDSPNLIVVAIARARNSGMKVYHDDRILNAGVPPIVMEPVKAEITLHRTGLPTVYLLDHSGRRTDKTLPVVDGKFEIDGARDRTCYYLVRYREKLRN